MYAVLVKKNIGNAAKRNYCKRIAREYIRKNIHTLKKYNRIIFLINNAGDLSYNSLQEAIHHKLKDA
jgi:ribonuclease P protein component